MYGARFIALCLLTLTAERGLAQTQQLFQFTGTIADAQHGGALASAGDVDNDGTPDLLVGSSGPGNFGAFVYSGRSGAPLCQVFSGVPGDGFGWRVSTAGDLNQDDHAEFLVGAVADNMNTGAVYLFDGASYSILHVFRGAGPNTQFGTGIAGGFDFNGDGWGDIAIGAAWADTGNGVDSGAVYAYSGRPGHGFPLIRSWLGPQTSALMGYSIAGVPDVDQDGCDEILAGAHSQAMARLLNTKPGTGIRYEFQSPNATGGFGISVDSAGDVDGDNICDLLIGEYYGQKAHVYSGATGSKIHQVSDNSGLHFGTAVAGLGDVDGDAYSDFAVSNTYRFGKGGKVFVYSGRDGALIRDLQGNAAERFGQNLASCGDLNGDGLAEIMVGAHMATRNNLIHAGLACIFDLGFRSSFHLHQKGRCPGRITLKATGVLAGARVAFAYGIKPGSTSAKGCSMPVQLGIAPPVALAGIVRASGSTASVNVPVPASACGKVLVQALDLGQCKASNVLRLQ